MIIIEEKKCSKLSGLTSLFISFDYNPNIVDIIKSSEIYVYDKKEYTWEVPLTSLSSLTDKLINIDIVKLKLKKETSSKQEVLQPSIIYKTHPMQHQLDAIKYGLSHNKWLLLDAPGLGKTLTTIYIAEELHKQKKIEHCLIICGINSLKSNWKREIEKHSTLDSIIIGQKVNSKGRIVPTSIKERIEQLSNKIDEFFVIINVESLRDDKIIKTINNSINKFDLILFDEMHKAKSIQAEQSQNLLKLESKYKIGMTGSLIMNNPLDSYMPLVWIGVEKPHNITNFKKVYCNFNNRIKGMITGFKNLELLRNEIDSCSLRRTKDLLDLPEKNIINEIIDMNEEHLTFYENIKNGVKEEADKIELNNNNLLALTTRLRQATSCPEFLTSNTFENSKLKRCVDLVNEILSNNNNVVIMSNFKEPIEQLKLLFKKDLEVPYKLYIGTGDIKDEELSKSITKFQEEGSGKIFLGTIQKIGTGLTLTNASYMIFIDQPWTNANYIQACDRIHRIGSKNSVFIYNLICANTIDVEVNNLIESKEAISDYLIDNKFNYNILKKIIQDL